MQKRIAFIYFSFSSFIEQDYEMLCKHFDVERVHFRGIADAIKIIIAVRKSDVSYTWFVDGWAFFAVLASAIFGKKSIVVVGGYDVANEPDIHYGMGTKNIVRRWMTKFALKHADTVLPVSKFTQHETEKCTTGNIKMVYNGVDVDKFESSVADRETVLTVGGKAELKGLDTFVSAARSLSDKTFVIVGGAEDLISDPPSNLAIVGNVPYTDMVEYYQQAKVYCQLSYRESFGMALAESMTCGCIPVVTARGAMPEVVGTDGIYVTYGDVDNTVRKIEEAFVITDLHPRNRIETNFSMSRREEALVRVINFNLKDSRTRNRIKKSVMVADVKSGDHVLDLGCGDSAIKTLLPTDIEYTGVDMYSGDLLHDLENGIPNELCDTKLDVIFMNEFIEHIENFRSLLIQCKDMLAEGGRIIISTPSPNRIMFGEDPNHIHCFRKSNMRNLADVCKLRITNNVGTYLGIPYIPMISLSQTILTGVVIYRLENGVK